MKDPLFRFPHVLLVFLLGCGAPLYAQNILTDMDHDAHRWYDRMIILSGGGDSLLHSAIKPFWRSDLVALADSFSHYAGDPVSMHHVQTIWDQNNEFVRPSVPDSSGIQPSDSAGIGNSLHGVMNSRYRQSKQDLWNTFYRTPANFYEVDVTDFYLRINPLIQLTAGYESEEGVTTFTNQRGLSIRGGIGHNVYFQTSFYDSQVRFPNYINQYTDSLGVVPGAALYKNFESSIFEVSEARDFLLANAYVGIDFGKYFGIQLGHNQCFIGEGIRSLLMTDFSPPYFSLRFNTRIWKLHYQNIFAEVSADNFMSVSGFSDPVPKKYFAAHYLSFKPNPTFTIGLFETVIFDRPGHQFELQYLNPIILYRTIEGWIGSPDNVILGMNARLDLRRAISLYGQFILDDISIGEIIDGQLDWWGNKFGGQLGLKYINVLGLEFLDAQIEWNSVRPYTYSHYDFHANYSNYKQTLAHPLGANFNEWIFSIHYQPAKRMMVHGTLYLTATGEDIDSVSYGSNVLNPNTLRPGDYGHHIGQGVATDIVFLRTGLQYELTSGVYLDGEFLWRRKTSELEIRNLETSQFQIGLRYNMARREEVF